MNLGPMVDEVTPTGRKSGRCPRAGTHRSNARLRAEVLGTTAPTPVASSLCLGHLIAGSERTALGPYRDSMSLLGRQRSNQVPAVTGLDSGSARTRGTLAKTPGTLAKTRMTRAREAPGIREHQLQKCVVAAIDPPLCGEGWPAERPRAEKETMALSERLEEWRARAA